MRASLIHKVHASAYFNLNTGGEGTRGRKPPPSTASLLIFLAEGVNFTEKGLQYLKNKLSRKKLRVNKRYNYYEAKNSVEAVGKLIPDSYRNLSETLGWCGKAVDILADRIIFDCFDNDTFELNEIYCLNNPDILFDSAILSSLITSCSFIYIDRDKDDYPRMQVIDGGHATGEIDPVTNLLTEGYAVIECDKFDRPVIEAYLRPYQTDYYVNGRHEKVIMHKSPHPLLVPVINRPDARRPFGHSRISRPCMDIMQAALRTLLRSEVSAEFYSFPQKYILGLSDDAEFNGRELSLEAFLSFGKDENSANPVVGQFSQQSMTPYMDQLRTLASVFAGETGLTLDDLGFSSTNPSSSEAIRAAHENLRLTARKAQRTFGSGFINAGYLASCIRDKFEYDRRAFADTRALWMPVFEPDSAALAGIADGILKVNQALPGFLGEKNIRQLTGLRSDANEL